MNFSPINNLDKGLLVRNRLNSILSALILGSEGINNVWSTIRALQSTASGLSSTVQQNFVTLSGLIDNATNYTDEKVNELRNYINTVSGGSGGLGGFIDSLDFSPEELDNTTSCTLFTVLTGTFTNMKDSNNTAITISGSNKLSIFYREANVTYWTVRSLEITPTLDSAVALALSILQGTHSLQQLTKGGNKVAPITTTLAVVDADREDVLKNILDQYDSILIDSGYVFSSTKAYKEGDLCIYERELYRFTSNHSGLWSADDVVKTSLVSELVECISSFQQIDVTFASGEPIDEITIFDKDIAFEGYSESQKQKMVPNARYIEHIQGVVFLDSMGIDFDGVEVPPIRNGLVWDSENCNLVKYTGGVASPMSGNESLVYCNRITGYFYRFIGRNTSMKLIGGIPLIDNLASEDTDKGLTAKQGKALKELFDILNNRMPLDDLDRVLPDNMPFMVLNGVGLRNSDASGAQVSHTEVSPWELGGVYYCIDSQNLGFIKYFEAIGNNLAIVRVYNLSKAILYFCAGDSKFYHWDGTTLNAVSTGSGGASFAVIPNLTSASNTDALAASMGKKLNEEKVSKADMKTINNAPLYASNGGNINVPVSDVAGFIDYENIPRFILESINEITFANLMDQTWRTENIGKAFFFNDKIYTLYAKDGVGLASYQLPNAGVIYYCKVDGKFYRWNEVSSILQPILTGSTGEAVRSTIYVEEQENWSDNFVKEALQQFTVPVITDYIYFVSSAIINWENDTTKRNPNTWVSSDFDDAHQTVRPYAIADGQSNWRPLTTPSINAPSGQYIYVTYRSRILTDTKYSSYSTPVLMGNIDSSVLNSISDNTSWDTSKELRDNFIADHSVNLANAKATREFLQGIIDNAREDQIIVFPKDRTFVIDFDPSGYYDGQANMRMNYDPYEIAKMYTYSGTGEPPAEIPTTSTVFQTLGADPEYYSHVMFVGLNITHRVHIDLNGSTIKFAPNWLPNFKTIHIGTHLMDDNRPPIGFIGTDPSGTIIENGNVYGGREWTMFFPVHARTYKVVKVNSTTRKFVLSNFENINYEHGHAISATRKVELRHLDTGDTVGDGICVSSHYKWGDSFSCPSKGKINENGVISSSQDGDWYSDLVDISTYSNATMRHCDIVARPSHNNEHYCAKVDIGPFYISEYVTVAYYSGGTYKSQERIQFGDTLSVPDGCDQFRFFINIDRSRNNATASDKVGVMLCSIIWQYGSLVEDCSIHDCGRDGLTLACMKNSIVRNCRIFRCDQCQIDVEGTAYLDNDLYIEGLIVDPLEDNGIKSVTGDHFMLTRSKVNGVMSAEPYIHISDSDVQWLTLSLEPTSRADGPERTFNSNISKPRRVVRDTIIRGTVDCTHALFENCVFGGDFFTLSHNEYMGNYPNTFNNCTFNLPLTSDVGKRGLAPGIYNNCIIRSKGPLSLQMYWASKPELSRYEFNGCTFDVDSIYTPNNYGGTYDTHGTLLDNTGTLIDVDSCVFNIRGHMNLAQHNIYGPNVNINSTNFTGCYLRKFVNSRVNFTPSGTMRFEFFFTPYTNCRIEGNVFTPIMKKSGYYTNGTSLSLIKILLRSIFDNMVYDIVFKRNIVEYYGFSNEEDAPNSRLLFVQPITISDRVKVTVCDNTIIRRYGSIAAENRISMDLTMKTVGISTATDPDHDYVETTGTTDVTFETSGNQSIDQQVVSVPFAGVINAELSNYDLISVDSTDFDHVVGRVYYNSYDKNFCYFEEITDQGVVTNHRYRVKSSPRMDMIYFNEASGSYCFYNGNSFDTFVL